MTITNTAFRLWVVNIMYHSIVSPCHSPSYITNVHCHQSFCGFSVNQLWGDFKQATGCNSHHQSQAFFEFVSMTLVYGQNIILPLFLSSQCYSFPFIVSSLLQWSSPSTILPSPINKGLMHQQNNKKLSNLQALFKPFRLSHRSTGIYRPYRSYKYTSSK